MSTTGEAGRLVALGNNDSVRDGISLQAVTEAARRLDELSTARVVGLAATAVHAAQKGGQPLGTVSPTAIIVLPNGDVKLAPGASSPRYTAPEKINGVNLDRRSDVFALGVALWEALAHEKLFDGATDDAIHKAVLEKPVPPPSQHNANVPAELDAICKKALARDPADRYQSAKVMAAEIEAVLDDAGYPESNEQIAKYMAAAPKPVAAGTTPPPADKPLAKTQILGSSPAPLPSITKPAETKPEPPPGDTAKLGSGALSPPPPEPAQKPLAVTAFMGSNASAPPPEPAKPLSSTAFLGSNASTPPPTPAAPSILTTPTPEPPKPEPPKPEPPKLPVPAPFKPQMKIPASVANAETVATPIAAGTPTVQPQPLAHAKPIAGDREFTDEHAPIAEKLPDPIEAVSLPRRDSTSTGNKDVLAGWGWGTDAHAAIDDDDYEVPSNRRPLILAIGGACAVAAIIAIVALAFGGSKKDEDQAANTPPPAAKPEPAVQPPAPPPAPPPVAQPEVTPGSGSDTGSAEGSGSATPTEPTPPPPATAPEPPPPAAAAVVEPSSSSGSAANRGSASGRPEPPKPEPPKVEPPKKVETPKVVKVETPKKADKPPKKAEPVRVARAPKAQPIDPYAEPAKPKVDAAAAYRSGLQQYARGDNAGALSTFKGSLASNPNYPPTWRGIGLVYEKLGNKGQAKFAFKKYLQLAPNAGDADQIKDRLERLGS